MKTAASVQSTGLHHTFLPIYKIDEEQRLVFARLTDETVDMANEIMDYESSAPLFRNWSEHAEKVTGGKSKGNLRAMHQPIAAGKFVDIIFDDTEKSIDTVSHVVDDAEWAKVKAGVYTGLSLGGHVVGKMWKDAETGAMRYTVRPVEGSLVDLPCNPNATFTHVKAGGLEEQTPFTPWQPSNADVAAAAAELAKDAGEAAGDRDFIAEARALLIERRADEATKAAEPAPDSQDAPADEGQAEEAPAAPEPAPAGADDAPAAEPEAEADAPEVERVASVADWAPAQKWVAPDGKVFDSKRDCADYIKAAQTMEANGHPLAAALAAAKAAPAEALAASPDGKVEGFKPETLKALSVVLAKAVEDHGEALIEKGMYMVASLADVLQTLSYIQSEAAWEAEYEGDGSPIPQALAQFVAELGDIVIAVAQEEVAELVSRLRVDGEEFVITANDDLMVAAAAAALDAIKADEPLMTKAGARNSKSDAAKIQATHDAMVELGATCDAEKAAGAPLEKLQEVEAERDGLQAQINDALPGIAELGETNKSMATQLAAMQKRLDELAQGPAPMPALQPGARVVDKAGDATTLGDPADAGAVLTGLIERVGLDEVRRAVIKAAQANPVSLAARAG